jgi:hypothetical protein
MPSLLIETVRRIGRSARVRGPGDFSERRFAGSLRRGQVKAL